MFCSNCGTQNTEGARFCSQCGNSLAKAQSGSYTPPNPNPTQKFSSTPSPEDDKGADLILKIVSFCIPMVGLILYLVWRNEKPRSARDVCIFAAIGFGLSVLAYIAIMVFSIMASANFDTY